MLEYVLLQIRQLIIYGEWTFTIIYETLYITKSNIVYCILLTLFMQRFAGL